MIQIQDHLNRTWVILSCQSSGQIPRERCAIHCAPYYEIIVICIMEKNVSIMGITRLHGNDFYIAHLQIIESYSRAMQLPHERIYLVFAKLGQASILPFMIGG